MAATGDYWWLWLVGFLMSFQLLIQWIYPIFIASLFNKFIPLQDEALKDDIVALADKVGLPIHAIGVGESIEDLQPFDPEEFARALTGAAL